MKSLGKGGDVINFYGMRGIFRKYIGNTSFTDRFLINFGV